MHDEMMTYCGLYCGDCFFHKGEIADLARDLRKKLRDERFKERHEAFASIFKEFKDFERCYDVLGAMVRMRCKRACRNGGGPPVCKIRECCKKRAIDGCWECGEFETCKKLEFLEMVHKDAHIKNLRTIRKRGVDAFVDGKRNW
jgi:hypothetical protein